MTEQLDDLSWVDCEFTVSQQMIETYHRQGFVLFRDALPKSELARLGEEITRLTLELNEDHRPLEERDTYDRAFLQVMNLWQHAERVRHFVFGKRLASMASQLLGTEGVRLYHDQSLYKEPSGGITPAHADQYYWPLTSEKAVTAWIPLQPVPFDMGPLAFYAESHCADIGRHLPISDASEDIIRTEMQKLGFQLIEQPFDLGDVSFHAGWTFHRAGANQSTSPRSVMTMIYMDRDMRLAEPTNAHQENDRATWTPGAEVGQIIDTDINPVLFERSV